MMFDGKYHDPLDAMSKQELRELAKGYQRKLHGLALAEKLKRINRALSRKGLNR